jgi:hypothetical protein
MDPAISRRSLKRTFSYFQIVDVQQVFRLLYRFIRVCLFVLHLEQLLTLQVMNVRQDLLKFFPFRRPITAYLIRAQVMLMSRYLMFQLFGISLYQVMFLHKRLNEYILSVSRGS